MIEITAEQLPAVFMENLRSLGLNPIELSKSITTITAKTDYALFSEVSLFVRRTIKGMDSVARGGRGSEVVCEFQFKLKNPPSGEAELQAITRGFLRREVVGYQWVGSDNIVSRLNREDVTQAALSLGFEKVGYGDGRIR
ncbi:hypothetical protein HRbin02_01959 [Candidatus Calditenuaceae archaeon HR02]|nr:hypothetical protein HRbin02_01959 [Candidatus Calditenuaceae archaeon HR02]